MKLVAVLIANLLYSQLYGCTVRKHVVDFFIGEIGGLDKYL